MGRGRAKAKQVKVARQLKYGGGGTDLDRLRAELGVSTDRQDAGGGSGFSGLDDSADDADEDSLDDEDDESFDEFDEDEDSWAGDNFGDEGEDLLTLPGPGTASKAS